MVQLEAVKEYAAIGQVRQLNTRYYPGYTFEYNFLKDDFQKQYLLETRVSALAKDFAGLAILLSCFRLLGLSAFSPAQTAN